MTLNKLQQVTEIFPAMRDFELAGLVGVVAAAKNNLGVSEHLSLTNGGYVKVVLEEVSGFATVTVNGEQVEVFFGTQSGSLEITHLRVLPSERVNGLSLNLRGSFWDFFELVNVYTMMMYSRVTEGLIASLNQPLSELVAMKRIPKFTQYEVNTNGEEVVRVTYEFYEGSRVSKVEMYWAFGLRFPTPLSYGRFLNGKVYLVNGEVQSWS